MGNTDRGKEEAWKGPEGKNTSQTKARRKKKNVLYRYRLHNAIRHLWKLASELLMRMFFRLSLVSLRLPCLGSEISGVISTHTKLWVFIEISTRKKNTKTVKWWKGTWANTSDGQSLEFSLPCHYWTTPGKKWIKCLFSCLSFQLLLCFVWQ